MDMALNNLQRLICHKTKSNQAKPKNDYDILPKKKVLYLFPKLQLSIFYRLLRPLIYPVIRFDRQSPYHVVSLAQE